MLASNKVCSYLMFMGQSLFLKVFSLNRHLCQDMDLIVYTTLWKAVCYYNPHTVGNNRFKPGLLQGLTTDYLTLLMLEGKIILDAGFWPQFPCYSEWLEVHASLPKPQNYWSWCYQRQFSCSNLILALREVKWLRDVQWIVVSLRFLSNNLIPFSKFI